MIGITPTSVFPLQYAKSDPGIPAEGARAIPQALDFTADKAYEVNLLQLQDKKKFSALKCIWIDARECTHDVLVNVNGTTQIINIAAGSQGYWPVIDLNVPRVIFSADNAESGTMRVIFLNFFPSLNSIASPTLSGSVSVSNFPASFGASQVGTWDVGVTNFPTSFDVGNFPAGFNVDNFPSVQAVSQSGVWSVGVNNFPAVQSVSQSGTWTFSATQSGTWNVGVTNFPATQAVTQSGAWNVGVTNFPSSFDIGNFPATQAVTQSGTWTVNAVKSGTWTVGATQSGAWTIAATQSGAWSMSASQSGAWSVSVSNFPSTQAVTQSGTWAVNSNAISNIATFGISSTTGTGPFVAFSGATGRRLHSISVNVLGATLAAAGNCAVRIYDGATVIFNLNIYLTTTATSALVYNLNNLSKLITGQTKVDITTALANGSINVLLGAE